MTDTATETLSDVAKRTSETSAKAAAMRVAANAAKPQRSVANSPACKPTKAAVKELPAPMRFPRPRATAPCRPGLTALILHVAGP